MNGWALVILCLSCSSLVGCKTTTFEQVFPAGPTIRAKDTRFMSATTAQIKCTINPSNGVMVIKIKAANKGDTDFIEAVAAGAAKGAVQGVK